MTSSASPWWNAGIHRDRRPFLIARNRIKAGLRAFFTDQGFVEVEAAILQVSPGNEAHLHAFSTEWVRPDLSRSLYYLHTSPEFACKKLLAAGEQKIFDFARVFRNRESGALHQPEFTLLEWYRAGKAYDTLMQDCAALLKLAARLGGTRRFVFRGLSMDPFAEPERITVAEAFRKFSGIDLLATLKEASRPDRGGLAEQAKAAGIRIAGDDTWSDIYSRVLTERVEPRLGEERATLLYDYPLVEAALARPAPHDPRLAERFELYACGVELANAFGELIDPTEQRLRFIREMDEKQRVYGERYPLDETFLEALGQMPEACGAALGFDRLAMLATGAARLDQVIWTPL